MITIISQYLNVYSSCYFTMDSRMNEYLCKSENILPGYDRSQKLYILEIWILRCVVRDLDYVEPYCQTPSPVQNWELTLLSLGNKNKNKPHLISCRRGCIRVVKTCVLTILSLIRWKIPHFPPQKWRWPQFHMDSN